IPAPPAHLAHFSKIPGTGDWARLIEGAPPDRVHGSFGNQLAEPIKRHALSCGGASSSTPSTPFPRRTRGRTGPGLARRPSSVGRMRKRLRGIDAAAEHALTYHHRLIRTVKHVRCW